MLYAKLYDEKVVPLDRVRRELVGVDATERFDSVDEARRFVEALFADVRARGQWSVVLDRLSDVPSGAHWDIDLVRGIDRVEVIDEFDGLAAVALIDVRCRPLWATRGALRSLIASEKLTAKVVIAEAKGDKDASARYRILARAMLVRARVKILLGDANIL